MESVKQIWNLYNFFNLPSLQLLQIISDTFRRVRFDRRKDGHHDASLKHGHQNMKSYYKIN